MARKRIPDFPVFRLACVQMTSTGDPAENLDQARRLVLEAVRAGARLVATPENTGLMTRDPARLRAASYRAEAHPVLAGLRQTAASAGCWILVGSLSVRGDGETGLPVNRSFLVDDRGGIVCHYDKLHLFDVSLPGGESYRESGQFAPGDHACLARTPFGWLGMTICYDLRFPRLYRRLAQAGATLLAVPAAFAGVTGRAHWEVLLRARAIENACFVLAPAQSGTHPDGRRTHGHSMIIAPWGECLASAGNDGPGLVMAEIDHALVREMRERLPSLYGDRPFRLRRAGSSPAAGDPAAPVATGSSPAAGERGR